MRKRILAVMLVLVFLFTSSAAVYAKGARSFGGGRSSFSRSSGSSKSFSKSYSTKSYSTKSSSKSSSSFGSTASKSSTSRSLPGSSSSSSSKSKTSGFSGKSTSKKSAYMSDTYKSQVSSKNYNAYKQKLNADQQKVYNDSMKRSYGNSSRRMNFENAMNTRASRINVFNNRPIFINVNHSMFGSPFSYGYAYVGPWDLWFLMRASDLFWFHHWHEISPYRSYFDDSQYRSLEDRVKKLEQEGVQRDPNYLDADVDPDLQLSQQYQEQNVDKVYYTDKHPTNSTSAGTVVILVIITSVVLIIVIRKLSKPKKKKSHYSSIY